MPRLPYAAQVLIDQVSERKPRTTVEPVGEPDGFDVVRGIKFDKATSKWLGPIMEQLSDRRVHSVNTTEAGFLHVVFTARSFADDREPFPLEDAEFVAKQAARAAKTESGDGSGGGVEATS